MQTDHLRRAFRDISAGCSRGAILTKTCWIKHLSYADEIGFDNKRDEFFAEAKEAGLLTNDEKLVVLIRQELWSDKKEQELVAARNYIQALIEGKRKNASMPSMVKGYNKQIEQAEQEYRLKILDKRRLLELTCEVFADRCVHDHYIISNLFEDPAMTRPLFSADEFDWFRDDKVSSIVQDYNASIDNCSDQNIKRLAMQPFFQRYFQITGENITQFFAKPVCELTFYQVDLLRWGTQFRHIFQTHEVNTWKKEVLEDPDMLLDYAAAVSKGKEKMQELGANDPDAIVLGMKKEDAKTIGVKSRGNVAADIVNKHGGNVMEYFASQGG